MVSNAPIAAAVCSAVICSVPTGADVVEFIGTDADWHNPANWSTGTLPGEFDDVVIDDLTVNFNPALATGTARYANITLKRGGVANFGDGTVLTVSGDIRLEDQAQINYSSSEVNADRLVLAFVSPELGFGTGDGGFRLNPTTKDQRDIVVDTTESGKLTFGLGGTLAAAPGATGAGRYATLAADTIDLGSALTLETALLYSFAPRFGDSFRIIDARQSYTGTFAGLADGDVVTRFGEIDLVINYDGTGVTLNAVPAPATVSLLGVTLLTARRRR